MPPLQSQWTLTPFLYPSLLSSTLRAFSRSPPLTLCRHETNLTNPSSSTHLPPPQNTHLNPPPTDYSRSIFFDRATITVHAGRGGHGCISFLRELFIPAGPANGGDGGTGGNIYIQAICGETSLHKLARRNAIRAGRGMNGQGKNKGGERGEDVVIEVPVGTVVREIARFDPVADEEARSLEEAGREHEGGGEEGTGPRMQDKGKFLLYPAITSRNFARAEFPKLPRGRRPALAAAQVQAPVSLDLSEPMEIPLLLLAGATGGLGNPHFVTKNAPRPKFATKGEGGTRVTLELELKLLADVGLVGLPNAGKSTLLRAMSNSRARIGEWAFTTLQPNLGTVVLDSYKGRPLFGRNITYATGEQRTNFTIADIPGLVRDAHLDRGLGISFLRHVERAGVLAFVVDLNAGDAVEQLKGLWKEVCMYGQMKMEEEREKQDVVVEWTPFGSVEKARERKANETIVLNPGAGGPMAPEPVGIKRKPWFVVATKADLEGTRKNFEGLRAYLERVESREVVHPSEMEGGGRGIWDGKVTAIPVSAINGHGMERITEWVVGLLEG